MSGCNGFELYAEFIGEFAAFGEKFVRNFFYCNLIYLAIYEYAVHVLSDCMAVQQFFYQSLYIVVAAGEAFALLGFEYDVLYGFNLGG